MKRMLMMACAATAALMMTEGTASAQCGYGGGYSRGFNSGYYGGSGISIGYSSYAPRSSFSIGYNSFPSYRTSYRSRGHYDYHPTSLVRHRNHYHIQPGHWDYHRGRHRYHR